MFVRYASLTAILATCVALAACNDTTNGTNNATIRFVNAIPDATSLSFSANGQTPGTGIPFGDASACQSITPGSTTFSVTQTGSGTTLLSIPSQTLRSGTSYTVAATGSIASPTFVFLTDTFTAPAANRALLRVVNALPSTAGIGVDVFVAAPGTPLGTANQTSVGFNAVVPFLNIPAGTNANQVSLTAPGTQTVLATSGPLSLASGEVANLMFTAPPPGSGSNVALLVPVC